MVRIPLIYRYLGGFLGFFVSFLVTFRDIFHLWSDLWNDFGTPLEVQLYLWKTCTKPKLAPICIYLHLCLVPTVHLACQSIKERFASIYRAF